MRVWRGRASVVAVGVVTCIISGCASSTGAPVVELPAFVLDGVEPVEVAVTPYDWDEVTSLDRYELDDRGLPVVRYDGQVEEQPTTLAAFGLINLNSWRLTGDRDYLDNAIRVGTQLLRLAEDGDGARPTFWFAFHFDFPLHGNVKNTIRDPWYSAMTQGQVLSLFVRLYRATGGEGWKIAGARVFNTFLQVASYDALPKEPWIDFVDERGYLWLEEYAGNVDPMMVLNGHIYAMFGLYDWWVLTGDVAARWLFDGAAATVLHYVPELRTPGHPSWYGYRIRNDLVAQSETYHYEHIWQLGQLAKITGDPRFHDLADDLYSDFGKPSKLKQNFPG